MWTRLLSSRELLVSDRENFLETCKEITASDLRFIDAPKGVLYLPLHRQVQAHRRLLARYRVQHAQPRRQL